MAVTKKYPLVLETKKSLVTMIKTLLSTRVRLQRFEDLMRTEKIEILRQMSKKVKKKRNHEIEDSYFLLKRTHDHVYILMTKV